MARLSSRGAGGTTSLSKKGLRVIKASRAGGGQVVPTPGAAPEFPVENLPPVATLEEARRRARALEQQAGLLLEEAREAAATRLAEAEAEAAEILAAARREAEAILAEAREQGWAEGYREGEQAVRKELAAEFDQVRARAEQELAAARTEADAVRSEAMVERERLIADLEPELVALSLSIARQILRTELQLQPDALSNIVAAALVKVRGEERVRLRVHPEDLDRVAAGRGEWQAALGGGDVELVPDPALGQGEFILQSGQGLVDGRLDAQLQQVAAALSGLGPVDGGEEID